MRSATLLVLAALLAGCAENVSPRPWATTRLAAEGAVLAIGFVDEGEILDLVTPGGALAGGRALPIPPCDVCVALALADDDGDGFDDLWALTPDELVLARATPAGYVESKRVAPGGVAFALADLDHDASLEALVLDASGALRARPPGHAPMGEPLATRVRAFAATFVDDDTAMDVVVATPDGLVALLNDPDRPGSFSAGAASLPAFASARSIFPFDLDNDQRMDLVVAGETGVLLVGNAGSAGYRDRTPDLPGAGGAVLSALATDVDHDGWPDVVAVRDDGAVLMWRGAAFGARWEGPERIGAVPGARALGAADVDGDGRLEILVPVSEGAVVALEAPEAGRWFGLRLRGNASNPAGLGAKVTLAEGTSLMMRQSGGVAGPAVVAPAAEARFGLGEAKAPSYELAILWPAGTLQFERVPPERIVDVKLVARESESESPWDSC